MAWQFLIQNDVREMIPSTGLLFLRICIGSMMILIHGLPKLMNFKEELSKIEDPFGLGARPTLVVTILQELGLSALIILGLGTRLAVLPLAATMVIAGFIVHRDWSFEKRQFILLYLIAFLTLALTGAGAFSLDALILQRLAAV